MDKPRQPSLRYRILLALCLVFVALAAVHFLFGGLWAAPGITVIVAVAVLIAILKVNFPGLFVPRS